MSYIGQEPAEKILTADNIADGSVTTPKIATSAVTSEKLSSGAVEGAIGSSMNFRNKIYGGDFTTNPWQRGTSFPTLGGGNYSADRWNHGLFGGTVGIYKTADAPTAEQAGVFTQHCFHLDVETTATPTASQSASVRQFIEGYTLASFGFGQTGTRYVTLSFWHKHTKTGVYCVSIVNAANNRSYVAEYTQSVTDTWEKAVITIPVDTTGTWVYDNTRSCLVFFTLAAGADYQTTPNTWQAGYYNATANQVNALDSTANNFKIALVQLQAGSVATPFETRPYGVELALCQRYYYRINPGTDAIFGNGYSVSTTQQISAINFPVSMRTAPTALEQSGTATDYKITGASDITCSSVPAHSSSCSSAMGKVLFTVASGLTAGQGNVSRGATANGYLAWSAEL